MCVTRWATITSQKRLAENFGWSTIVPPTPSVLHIDQLCALTWKNGRKIRYTPSGCMPMLFGPTRAAQSALAWVWTTAFGREVVPEVNMTPTGSMGSEGRTGASTRSPNSESNRSKSSVTACAADSPESSGVTAIQCRSGPLSRTIAAYFGCVIAATAPVCSMK